MNFIIYLLSEGLSKIIPFISILVLAKFIDVASFGELTIYFIVYELLIILISNNITATTRIDYFKLSFSDYVQSKSAHIVVSFYIFLLVLLIGLFFSNISYLFLSMLSISAFLRTISYYNLSNLQCKEDAKSYGISNFIYLISMNGLFVFLVIFDYGIYSWFYSILFGAFIQFIYSALHINKSSLLIFDKKIILNKQNLIKEFKNGIIFIPQAIGFWVKLGIDRILLAHFTSTLIVGYYMFAFQLSLPIIILSTVINLYMTPKINKLLKINAIAKIQSYLFKFAVLLIILSIIDYAVAFNIIDIFYYEKYHNSLDILAFIVIANLLYSISLVYINIFYYIDKKKFVSYLVFSISLFQVILSYIGSYMYKLDGILYSTICVNIIFLIIILYALNNNFKRMKSETIN